MALRPSRILVVDDDLRLRMLLNRYFTEQGFSVLAVSDGAGMDRALARDPFDLCKRLRVAGNDIAILMLTAKGDDMDRIIGLDFGAGDYISEPFNPRELVARINAILRRRIPVVPYVFHTLQ